MTTELDSRCRRLVEALGLGQADDVTDVRPLTGGVASDIAAVRLPDREICVKFALPKLKVAADWFAPVHRNAAEYAWLSFANRVAPEAAVDLYGHAPEQHGFAMEMVAGRDVYLWKSALLDGAPDRAEARAVGDLLGRIHAASAKGVEPGVFDNRADFHALRIEPYLLYTAGQHPDLAETITALDTMLAQAPQVLVHGDVSPKNILFRDGRPVILDAECATLQGAAFDPSFCLNHLILKAIHLPASRDNLLDQVGTFWAAYAPHVDWQDPADLERQVCRLVPALMLARVDGKSPVEYFTDADRTLTRAVSRGLIADPAPDLHTLTDTLRTALKDYRT